MAKIRVIIKRPDEEFGHVAFISDSLKNLQKTVEGYIEMVSFSKDITIICNEDGKLLGLPYNCMICGTDFVGTLIFAGGDACDGFKDLSISFKDYKKLFFGDNNSK